VRIPIVQVVDAIMSENIPESIPTSADPKSRRPVKKARGATTPISAQSNAIEALFHKQPDIHIPESATRGYRTSASLAPPPEIVANVQGSSAGAGSGEFHVYKAARRREYERIRLMEEESLREEQDKEWHKKQETNRAKDEGKLSKNQKRRQKLKENKTKEPGPSGEHAGTEHKMKDVGTTSQRAKNLAVDNSVQSGISVAGVIEDNGIVIHED